MKARLFEPRAFEQQAPAGEAGLVHHSFALFGSGSTPRDQRFRDVALEKSLLRFVGVSLRFAYGEMEGVWVELYQRRASGHLIAGTHAQLRHCTHDLGAQRDDRFEANVAGGGDPQDEVTDAGLEGGDGERDGCAAVAGDVIGAVLAAGVGVGGSDIATGTGRKKPQRACKRKATRRRTCSTVIRG